MATKSQKEQFTDCRNSHLVIIVKHCDCQGFDKHLSVIRIVATTQIGSDFRENVWACGNKPFRKRLG